jgi:hypothetical protein
MVAGLLVRHDDCEALFVLSPDHFVFVAQQLHIADLWGREWARGRQRLDEGQLLRPAHDECVECVTFCGEAHFAGCQLLSA